MFRKRTWYGPIVYEEVPEVWETDEKKKWEVWDVLGMQRISGLQAYGKYIYVVDCTPLLCSGGFE